MTYTNPDQIGEVTEITGIAKIIRADGSEEPITLGAEVFIGDIVETEGDGAVNIGFVDDSSFAVSEDARISIDEFVFDPASESGDQDFSVVRGVFMYTSGLIGRENPDSVEIDTPVGSIGIRGTIIGGKIVPDGESQVSVLEGAIVVRNDGGERLLTNQFDTVLLSSRDVAPSEPKTLDVSRVANDYRGVKSVSSSLFSSFDDQMQQDQSPNDVEGEKGKGDVEGKADEAPEDQVEDKEASAEEVVDETAEDAVVEEVKEAQATQELKLENSESQGNIVKESKTHRSKAKWAKKIASRDEVDREDEQADISVLTKPDSLVVNNKVDLNENADGSAVGVIIGEIALSSGASNVTYSLANDAGGKFVIHSVTGVISFVGANSGNAEANDIHVIHVRAVNNDTGQVTAKSYDIEVKDTNESAEITGETTILASISENDEDVGLASDVEIANLTFSEVDGNIAHHTMFSTNDVRFEVQEIGGVLKLVAVSGAQFDYETETSVSVEITQTDGANAYSSYTVSVSIDDINDESPTDINLSSNNVAENSSASTVVGFLSAVDADASGTYTYSITSGNAAGKFSIFGNEIHVAGALDFETASSYDLDIEVDDGNGNTHTKTVTIGVDDLNENPEIHGAFQDKFSVTGDIDGVVPFGVDGAMVTRLHINDPDGDVFGVGDLSITGSVFGMAASNFFEIVDVGGNFVLKLLAGYQIIESSGNFLISNDGSTLASGASAHVTPTFDLGVSLNDGGGNTATETITVSANDVEHVTGTAAETLSASDDIVFGDSADNIMILGDDYFKFIKGGDGHDMIKLNGGLGMQTFDFTSTVSNVSGNSADLKSIEEFRFVDSYDELKLNLQDLKDLLKTSDNGEIKFAMGAGNDTLGGNESKNGVYFNDGGSDVYLTDHGFTKESGTVDRGGETFVEYSHSTLGSVLIEANIEGASTGGIV
jgi:hypothetical protein